jgi:hypothetical protein
LPGFPAIMVHQIQASTLYNVDAHDITRKQTYDE